MTRPHSFRSLGLIALTIFAITLAGCGKKAEKSAEKTPVVASKTVEAAAKSAEHAEHAGHGDHAEAVKPAAAPAHAEHADHADHAEKPAAKDFGLKRNGDKAWKMDAHTRDSMANLAKIVAADGSASTVEAYHAVATKMQAELKLLVRGCTMDGPNHDMLHVYLSALFPAVGTLAKSADVKALGESLGTIKQLMTAYPRYFE